MLGVLFPAFTRLGHEGQGSVESGRWNYVHRLDLGLRSHPKELGENGVRKHVKPKEEDKEETAWKQRKS